MSAAADGPSIQPPHLLFAAAPSLQRRKVFITNTSRTERLAFRVRTNAPDRVSVDAATGVVHPRCTVAVRVFWSGGGDDAASAAAARSPPVVVVSSRCLPASADADADDAPGGIPCPDAVLPVLALPRLADADGAAGRLRAAAAAAGGPSAAAVLTRALVDVLYCEGVLGAEGAVLALGAAALSVAPEGDAAVAQAATPAPSSSWFKPRPVTPAAAAAATPADSPPPAPVTPGASPPPDAADAAAAAASPPLPPAPPATADDVADELVDCLERLRGVMHAADAGLPVPARGEGGRGGAAAIKAPEPAVAEKVKFFESLFSYGAAATTS